MQERACVHEHSVLEMQAVLHGEHLDALARRWSEQHTRGRTAMERTRVDPDLTPYGVTGRLRVATTMTEEGGLST